MAKNAPVIIKKYPNRRLYNTETSKYITLDDLSLMVKNGVEFQVTDIKTNEDLTRVTLAQIILDHEMKGYELLPIEVLKQVIKLYDHPLNQMFSNYILNAFAQWNQSVDKTKEAINSMHIPFNNKDWQGAMDTFNKNNEKLFSEIIQSIIGR